MRNSCGVSFEHLLLHCFVVRELWILTSSPFGIWKMMPSRVIVCFFAGRVCIDNIIMGNMEHSSMYNMDYVRGKEQ